MMNNKRKLLFTLFFLLIFSLGLGYASLRTELTQTGVVNIVGNVWNINLNNIIVPGDNTVVPSVSPTISNRKTISYSLTLSNPGDRYDFFVYITNSGTLNAMLDNISASEIPAANSSDIAFTVTYADGTAINQYNSLAVGRSRLLKVHTEFVGSTSNPANLDLSLTFNYTKATGAASEPSANSYTIYSTNSTLMSYGSSIASIGTIYLTQQGAMNAYGHDFYISHSIYNNAVNVSSLGYVYNYATNYLQGGFNESAAAPDDQMVYNGNKYTLETSLGTSNCTDYTTYYECITPTLTARVDNTGYVTVTDNVASCTINSNNTSSCS